MFFISKFITPFLLPPGLIIVLLCITLLAFIKNKKKLSISVLTCTFIIVYCVSIQPIAYILNRGLEGEYLVNVKLIKQQQNSIIVVLGGGASIEQKGWFISELSGSSWRRLWRGIELYKQLDKKVKIIYSGDSGNIFGDVSNEASLAKKIALGMGVDDNDFITDSKARTTRESAINIKKILDTVPDDHKIYTIFLVTSAWHMSRSVESMRREGMMVIPIATDFSDNLSFKISIGSFLPSLDSFDSSVTAMHEWLGRLVYHF